MCRKQILSFSVIITVILLFQLSSCIKVPDPLHPGDAANVYTNCRIKQIVTVGQYASFTRIFTYNSNNDPVSETGPLGPGHGGTGSPDLSFKYDNKHRLIEFAGLYGGGGYEYLHHYTYDKNRIVIDSNWGFGQYGVPALPSTVAVYRYLTYDKLDRIVKDSLAYINFNVPNKVFTYDYDQNGNLATASKMYDDKLNPHRTNRVWMFIDRDYSVNNPVAATTYNSSGLPLKINLNAGFLSSYYDGPTDISYDCK
jgi:hypothetical protein